MKKQIIFGSFLAFAAITNAQNTPWPASGNIGIGTLAPGNTLEVFTLGGDEGITVTKSTSGNGGIKLNNTSIAPGHSGGVNGRNWGVYSTGYLDPAGGGNFLINDVTSSSTRFMISGATGNVAIGSTYSPSTKLDVTGSVRVTTNMEIGTPTTNLNPLIPLNIVQGGLQNDGIKFIAQSGGRAAFEIVQTSSQLNSRFKIFGDGSTYIGNFPSLAWVLGAPMLTVGGDVRFAAYGGGNAAGNGVEILGNNKTPFRRGISTSDDANGAFNFFVNNNQTSAAFNFKEGSANTNLMTLLGNGKLGIGTTGPEDLLQVGSAYTKMVIGSASSSALNYGTSYIGFNASRQSTGWATTTDFSHNGGSAIYGTVFGDIVFATLPSSGNVAAGQSGISDGTVWQNRLLQIKADGKIVMGTKMSSSHYSDADLRLNVDGTIACKGIYVTALTDWPDYVFVNNYKLPNLYDIEKYYKKNKHLPEIPSAKEIEEKGIDVGQMNTLLLKKIEELTVHMVAQQRQIDELKNKR